MSISAPVSIASPPRFGPWPVFGEEEQQAALQVLASGKVNYWTGSEGKEFECAFAQFAGTQFAIALMNGTIAIEAALEATGIGAGDEVIVTPRSFMASASAIVRVGATPIFCDVELDSGNISARTIEPRITPKTKAVIAVHLGGWPCEMDEINSLAATNGVIVIEDCAQAHGARYRNNPVGSLSKIAAWSFCQDKIISTAGEGGAVTTNDEELWSRIWSLKDHGKSFDAVFKREHPPGFRWLHESFGTNWRLTEIQAVTGRIALTKMADWHRQRSENAQSLAEGFRDLSGLHVPQVPSHLEHAYYRFYVSVEPYALKSDWSRDRIMAEVTSRKAPVFSGSCSEMYREYAFKKEGLQPVTRLENAKVLGENSLCFLVHPTLGQEQMAYTVQVVSDVLTMAVR